MSAIDFTGLCVLIYATVVAVWTLCDCARETPCADDERPSALPRRRW